MDPIERKPGLSDEELMAVWNAIPFYKNHNLVLTALHEGKATLEVRPVPDIFRGGLGTDAMNGGMLAYVVDGVTGAAIASMTRGVRRTGTLNLGVQYLRALRGDAILATASVVRYGRNVAFARADLCDADGKLCTTGEATYALLDW